MPKTYDFKSIEQRLYAWWQKNGWFKPEIAKRHAEPFVISMPPPNVTGELHLGHAMFVSVEDLMVRHRRMRGDKTLWVPGSDHAGIATQLQVEKHLLRTEEVTREELGRMEFEKRVWDWKTKYGNIITEQLRRLGASADWDRERFTLDAGLSRAVREAFVRLYEKGLIYRGTYLVNWSPGLKTAVSDLEVEYKEEQATLYYFKYRLAGRGRDEYIPVATTRPETILGDTAVAVHPDDERYRHLIGETVLVPILNRTIPVIHDTLVDPAFGAGALKITPGHDPTDYEIGQRHGLPIVSVLNPDATMNENAGPYQGLDRFACRKKLWADMEAAGLTIKTEPYLMNVPRSQRGGEIVEPLISTQWYVKIKPLAGPAIEAVRSGRIKIVPERFVKVYYNWMENIRDWCISRQLWWGHRIPVWTCKDCGHEWAAREDPFSCANCGRHNIEQDPDVLDTWFSSGLWPFSTLGWPDETPDLKEFYPTSVMETGYDILFFWVARMIMFGLDMTGKPPFHTVYLHGIVRDRVGRRMSKTLGNGVDPLWILNGATPDELPEYVRDQFPNGLPAMGADALRFTLLTGSTPGNDMNLDLQRVEANRNFANKIWNVARFVIGNLDNGNWKLESTPRTKRPTSNLQPPTANLQLPDRWIISRLNHTITDVTRLIDDYQFGEAGRLIYEFIWNEFADWYIEMAKLPLNGSDAKARQRAISILVHTLDQALRLLHPFMPFVTEEVWQHLKRAGGDKTWPEALIIAPWPQAGPIDAAAETDMQIVMDAIRAIRNARAEYNVKPDTRLAAMIVSDGQTRLFESRRAEIAHLARIDADGLHIAAALNAIPDRALPLVLASATIYLPFAQLVDVEAERARLKHEQADVQAQIARSQALLGGDFGQKAPPPVVQKERDKLAALQERSAKLDKQIKALA